MVRGRAKEGEITSPLLSAVLAARVRRYLVTESMFPGNARKPEFTDREWNIVDQALRIATKMLQENGHE